MDNDDLRALEIIKKHIRFFKKPVDINTEKISIYLLKNGSYDDDFDFLKKWIKQVEKERGWRL